MNYGGLMLDASFAQADLSPKALLLGSRAIRDYCLGTLDKNSNAHKLTDKGSVPIYAGNYVMAITILDKDLHLVGYCVTPETLTGNAVEFKRCHLDATKEIDALKKKSAEIEKTIPAFDSSAVWCEVFTTSSTTEYNIGLCPAYLQFDRDKLPVSMKDFAYYSCYSGGDTMTLRYAWCHNALSHLVDSKDYSTIIPCGLTKKLHNVHIVNEGIVILYDEHKEPIGYTHLTSDMALRENLTQ